MGTDFTVVTSATTISAVGSANSQRQSAMSTKSAERNMPRMPPPPATAVHTPMALPRRSSGKVEVMTARVIGMIIAAPTPLIARAAIMTSALGDSAATTFAMPNNVSPAVNMGLRPRRSPIAPSGSSSAARVRV